MLSPKPDLRIDETDAKAGTATGSVRWILAISLTLAIVVLSAIWMTGALSQDAAENAGTATERAETTGEPTP
jgi:hypothetical protein